MRRSAIHALIITSISIGLVGCQTGPRWAWWKKPSSPLASSAGEPALPSTSASPQAVAATGLEPVASPSATNLAAAQAAPAATGSSLNASESAPVVASGVPAPPVALAGTPALPPSTLANVPPTGPYDPSGYRPAESGAAIAPSTEPVAAAAGDRYAMASAEPASSIAPTSPAGVNGAQAVAVDDRYSLPAMAPVTQEQYANTPAESPVPAEQINQNLPSLPPAAPAASEYGNPSSAGSTGLANAPPVYIPAVPATIAPVPNASSGPLELTSATGQYRPGGTSSFPSGMSGAHVEIATRPSPAAATPVPYTAPVAAPWTPPTSVPSAIEGGTRTY